MKKDMDLVKTAWAPASIDFLEQASGGPIARASLV